MSETAFDLKVDRIHKLTNNGKIVGIADLNINGALVIKGLRIVNGQRGIFVAMPQTKGKDDRWYNIVECLSEEARQSVSRCVLAAYEGQ